jgi:sirohydrochlorin cobaltochelatase
MSESRLVLYAHGSPDPRWREPFERLAAELVSELGASRVRLAYMESAEPSLEQVAAEAAAQGVGELRILPVFLASGVHVRRDVEGKAAAIRAAHPPLEVEVLSPIGEDARVVAAVLEVARESA